MTLERLKHFHRSLAALALNTLILLLLINLPLFVLFAIKDGYTKKEPEAWSNISTDEMEKLKRVYPNSSEADIRGIYREMVSPLRPFIYDPYTAFREPPFSGVYLNIDVNGFRHVKNQAPWPPDRNKYFTIFLFGGSTTLGFNVPDDQTIASHLQELLSQAGSNKEIRVYNFGQASFYSTQERIFFERLITAGFVPDVAIFIDGLNDFYFYKDQPIHYERLKALVDGNTDKKKSPLLPNLFARIPMVRAAISIKSRLSGISRKSADETIDRAPSDDVYNDRPILLRVIERYASHKQMVDAVAAAYHIKTVFVWQPVPLYKYDLKHHLFGRTKWGRYAYIRFGYHEMAAFVQRHPLGDNFLWLADMQENLNEPLYVDATHYSGNMSRLVASNISGFLKEKNFLPVKNHIVFSSLPNCPAARRC